jgi:hypothetical protein
MQPAASFYTAANKYQYIVESYVSIHGRLLIKGMSQAAIRFINEKLRLININSSLLLIQGCFLVNK